MIRLTHEERAELTRRAENSGSKSEDKDSRRARVILMLDAGKPWNEIIEQLECSRGFVDQWRQRFETHRLAGLSSLRSASSEASTETELESRIIAATRLPPPDGAPRWSTRALGAQLGVSHMKVQRVWLKHGLSPQAEKAPTLAVPLMHGRSPKNTVTDRGSTAVRERILREAAAAIRLHGPQGIGVADVVSNAGVTQNSFYTYFKSKEQLVSHAIGYMFDQRYGTFVSYVQLNVEQPEQAICSFVSEYLSPEHRDAPESGCPMPVMAAELPRLHSLARQQFGFGVDRLLGGLSALLLRMGVEDPKPRAQALLSELVGALTLARALPDPEEADEFLLSSRSAIHARLKLPDSAVTA